VAAEKAEGLAEGCQGHMAQFKISIEKEAALTERMQRLGVKEGDLEESFIRSSGPGGQKVNKTSTCVFIRHLPTGLSVKCQRERSQSINRFLARRLLLDKIERMQSGIIDEEKKRIEKIRRQKRKRSKRAKEKMLEEKHHDAQKKRLRSAVAYDTE
jgi:protein subunit release factor B